MARARNLKPGFFKNEDLAALGFPAMILFAGLWTQADRAGRLEDRPKRIKAEVFPYSSINVDALLGKLAGAGFIVRYEVNGAHYISIPTWKRHQNPNIKEPASIIPEPESNGSSTVPAQCQDSSEIAPSPFPLPVTPSPSPQPDVACVPGREWPEDFYRLPITMQDLFVSLKEAHPKQTKLIPACDAFIAKVKAKRIGQFNAPQIIESHVEACHSAEWLKEGGRYVPPLNTWVDHEGWHDRPKQQNQTRKPFEDVL